MDPSILVAEDHEGFRKFLCQLLRDEGYHVVGAEDGIEAIEEIENARFDLILSNLKMPRADGYELLRRANEIGLPVILISGYGDEQTRVEAIRRGARDYVFKPVSLDDLLQRVKSACP